MILGLIAKTALIISLTAQSVNAYSMIPGKGCGTQTPIKILETVGKHFEGFSRFMT